ncbi:MAG: hypothetical protein IH831_10665, partial [Planctomycetes bacterium]|nr:hypothetical protein [Planctomycetota bacterium]
MELIFLLGIGLHLGESLGQLVPLAGELGVPVLVDAAAQDHRFRELVASGADLLIPSAHKYPCATTGGIVAGRKDLVDAVYLQNRGIGRGMKAGKEAIVGAMAALEYRMGEDVAAWTAEQDRKVKRILEHLAGVPGLELGVDADQDVALQILTDVQRRAQSTQREETFTELYWFLLVAASAGVFLHAGIKFPWFVFFHKDSGLRPPDPPWNMRLAMILFAGLCIGLGVWPEFLYAMLPFPVAYQPYTVPHVVNMLQLLLFSGLAFFLMLPLMERTLTITLDFDWFYRKLGNSFVRGLDRASKAQHGFEMATRARLGNVVRAG